MSKKREGGWSGIGMATVGIDPTNFGILNGHPTKIPPGEIWGGVVKNCLPFPEIAILPQEIEQDICLSRKRQPILRNFQPPPASKW